MRILVKQSILVKPILNFPSQFVKQCRKKLQCRNRKHNPGATRISTQKFHNYDYFAHISNSSKTEHKIGVSIQKHFIFKKDQTSTRILVFCKPKNAIWSRRMLQYLFNTKTKLRFAYTSEGENRYRLTDHLISSDELEPDTL